MSWPRASSHAIAIWAAVTPFASAIHARRAPFRLLPPTGRRAAHSPHRSSLRWLRRSPRLDVWVYPAEAVDVDVIGAEASQG